jgi:hypothetical protein
MNPLAHVTIDPLEDTVNPLWEPRQAFSLVCFLSHSSRFSQFNISKYKRNGKILLQLDNLTFHNDDDDADRFEVQLVIGDEHVAAATATIEAEVGTDTDPESGTVASIPTVVHVDNKKIWQAIRSNESAVYLHALTVKHTDSGEIPEVITSETMNSGQGAYGVINMVKYDTIPKHFRHRYLLADLGFDGLISDVEAAQAALPSDTVMSYWKPEVAVRLVTDFSLYPLSHPGMSTCIYVFI